MAASAPTPQPRGSWAGGRAGGRGPVPAAWSSISTRPGCPLSLPGLSVSPSRYKAWESQPRGEIRSQFQPVPTERSYQDGTCRMEYFKLYRSPDRGRLIAAPSRGCGGGAGREGPRPQPPRSRPPARTPLPAGPWVPEPRRGGPAGRRRLDYRALGAQRGGRGAG